MSRRGLFLSAQKTKKKKKKTNTNNHKPTHPTTKHRRQRPPQRTKKKKKPTATSKPRKTPKKKEKKTTRPDPIPRQELNHEGIPFLRAFRSNDDGGGSTLGKGEQIDASLVGKEGDGKKETKPPASSRVKGGKFAGGKPEPKGRGCWEGVNLAREAQARIRK